MKLSGAGTTAIAVGLMGCGNGDGKDPEDILGDGGGPDAVDGGLPDTGPDVRPEDLNDLGPDPDLKEIGPDPDLHEVGSDIEDIQPDELGPGCPEMPDWVDAREPKEGVETTTICPYCGCGCGLIVTAADVDGENKVVNTEGDPDHPINEGALCSKGQALYQVSNNERRLTKVLHRAPGAADWDEVSWDDALTAIAAKVKATRDATFEETDGEGRTVNRTEGIGLMGSAALDNEECYALRKMATALGLVFIEHQARI